MDYERYTEARKRVDSVIISQNLLNLESKNIFIPDWRSIDENLSVVTGLSEPKEFIAIGPKGEANKIRSQRYYQQGLLTAIMPSAHISLGSKMMLERAYITKTRTSATFPISDHYSESSAKEGLYTFIHDDIPRKQLSSLEERLLREDPEQEYFFNDGVLTITPKLTLPGDTRPFALPTGWENVDDVGDDERDLLFVSPIEKSQENLDYHRLCVRISGLQIQDHDECNLEEILCGKLEKEYVSWEKMEYDRELERCRDYISINVDEVRRDIDDLNSTMTLLRTMEVNLEESKAAQMDIYQYDVNDEDNVVVLRKVVSQIMKALSERLLALRKSRISFDSLSKNRHEHLLKMISLWREIKNTRVSMGSQIVNNGETPINYAGTPHVLKLVYNDDLTHLLGDDMAIENGKIERVRVELENRRKDEDSELAEIKTYQEITQLLDSLLNTGVIDKESGVPVFDSTIERDRIHKRINTARPPPETPLVYPVLDFAGTVTPESMLPASERERRARIKVRKYYAVLCVNGVNICVTHSVGMDENLFVPLDLAVDLQLIRPPDTIVLKVYKDSSYSKTENRKKGPKETGYILGSVKLKLPSLDAPVRPDTIQFKGNAFNHSFTSNNVNNIGVNSIDEKRYFSGVINYVCYWTAEDEYTKDKQVKEMLSRGAGGIWDVEAFYGSGGVDSGEGVSNVTNRANAGWKGWAGGSKIDDYTSVDPNHPLYSNNNSEYQLNSLNLYNAHEVSPDLYLTSLIGHPHTQTKTSNHVNYERFRKSLLKQRWLSNSFESIPLNHDALSHIQQNTSSSDQTSLQSTSILSMARQALGMDNFSVDDLSKDDKNTDSNTISRLLAFSSLMIGKNVDNISRKSTPTLDQTSNRYYPSLRPLAPSSTSTSIQSLSQKDPDLTNENEPVNFDHKPFISNTSNSDHLALILSKKPLSSSTVSTSNPASNLITITHSSQVVRENPSNPPLPPHPLSLLEYFTGPSVTSPPFASVRPLYVHREPQLPPRLYDKNTSHSSPSNPNLFPVLAVQIIGGYNLPIRLSATSTMAKNTAKHIQSTSAFSGSLRSGDVTHVGNTDYYNLPTDNDPSLLNSVVQISYDSHILYSPTSGGSSPRYGFNTHIPLLNDVTTYANQFVTFTVFDVEPVTISQPTSSSENHLDASVRLVYMGECKVSIFSLLQCKPHSSIKIPLKLPFIQSKFKPLLTNVIPHIEIYLNVTPSPTLPISSYIDEQSLPSPLLKIMQKTKKIINPTKFRDFPSLTPLIQDIHGEYRLISQFLYPITPPITHSPLEMSSELFTRFTTICNTVETESCYVQSHHRNRLNVTHTLTSDLSNDISETLDVFEPTILSRICDGLKLGMDAKEAATSLCCYWLWRDSKVPDNWNTFLCLGCDLFGAEYWCVLRTTGRHTIVYTVHGGVHDLVENNTELCPLKSVLMLVNPTNIYFNKKVLTKYSSLDTSVIDNTLNMCEYNVFNPDTWIPVLTNDLFTKEEIWAYTEFEETPLNKNNLSATEYYYQNYFKTVQIQPILNNTINSNNIKFKNNDNDISDGIIIESPHTGILDTDISHGSSHDLSHNQILNNRNSDISLQNGDLNENLPNSSLIPLSPASRSSKWSEMNSKLQKELNTWFQLLSGNIVADIHYGIISHLSLVLSECENELVLSSSTSLTPTSGPHLSSDSITKLQTVLQAYNNVYYYVLDIPINVSDNLDWVLAKTAITILQTRIHEYVRTNNRIAISTYINTYNDYNAVLWVAVVVVED